MENTDLGAALFASLTAVFIVLPMTASGRMHRVRRIDELPPPSGKVISLAKEGRKIRAIRTYRRQTSAGLLEAAKLIEHTMRAG